MFFFYFFYADKFDSIANVHLGEIKLLTQTALFAPSYLIYRHQANKSHACAPISDSVSGPRLRKLFILIHC